MKVSTDKGRGWLGAVRGGSRTERLVGGITVVSSIALLAWALLPAGLGQGAASSGSATAAFESVEAGGGSVSSGEQGADGTGPVGSGAAVGAAGPGSPGSRAGGPTGTASGPLRATDVGVTASDITIGVGLIDLGGLADAGFGIGLRGDEKEVAAAFVDDLNKRGGIHGRRVKAHVYEVDPLDQSQARAACIRATEQDRVFAYVDTLSQYSASQQACFSIEHRVPIITPTPLSADIQAQAFPNQISPIQDDNRAVIGAVRFAHEHGFFGAGFQKLGLLDDTCEPSVNADAKRVLASVGVGADRVSEFTLDCDGNNAAGQTAQAALAHKGAGVTHVLVLTQYVQLQLYTTAAASQAFHPRYLVTDFGGLTADVSVENLDPEHFDRALGVTSSFSGAAAVGTPLSALAEDCNRALREHRLAPMRNVSGGDGLAAYLCETLRLFETLAKLAGPSLTRAALTGALPSVGTFRGSYTDTAIFNRPRKVSGGDTLAIIEWAKGCTCYRQTVGHRPAPA
jgi:hypothetical protein